MTDRRVLGVSFAGRDRTNDDLAGVHANACFDRQFASLAQIRRVALQFLLHAQRGVQRPLRMVLVRDRCAKQREDAIAGALHDVTVIPAHRIDHQLQRRIDNRARFLRIEILFKLGRSLDVGEQRRDRLALAFEIFRGRRLGHSNRRIIRFLRRRLRSKRRAALSTKAFAARIVGAALRTKIRECRTTIAAELLARWVFSIAIRAAQSSFYQERLAFVISLAAMEGLAGCLALHRLNTGFQGVTPWRAPRRRDCSYARPVRRARSSTPSKIRTATASTSIPPAPAAPAPSRVAAW